MHEQVYFITGEKPPKRWEEIVSGTHTGQTTVPVPISKTEKLITHGAFRKYTEWDKIFLSVYVI